MPQNPTLRSATTGQILMDVEHFLDSKFGHRVGGFPTLEATRKQIDIRLDAGETDPYVDPVHRAKLERFGHWYRLRGQGSKPDEAAIVEYERQLLVAGAHNLDRGWEAYEAQEKLEMVNGPIAAMSWPQLQRRSDYLESLGYSDESVEKSFLLGRQIAFTRITQHVARVAAQTIPDMGSSDSEVVHGLKLFRRGLLTTPIVSFSSISLSPQWQTLIQRSTNFLFAEVAGKVDREADEYIDVLTRGTNRRLHAQRVVDVDRLKDPTFINELFGGPGRTNAYFNPRWPTQPVEKLLGDDLAAERSQLKFAVLEKMDRVHTWQRKYLTLDRFDMTLVELANCESEMELARTELEASSYPLSAELNRQTVGRERVGPELGLERDGIELGRPDQS